MKKLIFLLLILLIACKPNEDKVSEKSINDYVCVDNFVGCYIEVNNCKELCNTNYGNSEKESSDKQNLIDCKNGCENSECSRLEKECVKELS